MEVQPHGFFVTGVSFSADCSNIVSTSADYCCCLTQWRHTELPGAARGRPIIYFFSIGRAAFVLLVVVVLALIVAYTALLT